MRFDPASYPGRPPRRPTLVFQGRTWPLTVSGEAGAPFAVDPAASGATVLAPGAARWSLAYGSNADPDRLIDKALDVRGAIVLPARVLDRQRAWEDRRTRSTGAIPLTLVAAPGARLDIWVLGVHASDTTTLDASEGRGSNYLLGRVGPVAVAARFLLADALAYGPTATTRVLTSGSGPALHPAVPQATAERLHAAGDGITMRADPLPRTVEGDWPDTPFEDLPMFVYGTLQPGGRRWDLIADTVEVVGAATTTGSLVATYYGYPAADLSAPGEIHGTLLAPRGPRAARELVARTDEIEDAPSLFHRTSALVHLEGAERRWAVTYEWSPEQGAPPGTVIPDGRWHVAG